jgi:hypothetical protein
MNTQIRIFVGLLVLWVMVIVGLAVWPASGARTPGVQPDNLQVSLNTAVFEHTGRWVVEFDPDGTTVFVREIRRQ